MALNIALKMGREGELTGGQVGLVGLTGRYSNMKLTQINDYK